MWEALCVPARMWAAQAEKVWRDSRQSSQRTRSRPDPHKPAGVERHMGCWNVSKPARLRVLIDNNLVQRFLRSVLCNPLFGEKCLESDFGGVGKTKGRTSTFVTTAQASEALLVLDFLQGPRMTWANRGVWELAHVVRTLKQSPHVRFLYVRAGACCQAGRMAVFCFVFSCLCF